MIKLYYRLKLWYYWNITLKKNEFSYKLSLTHIYFELNSDTLDEINIILVKRRDIVHNLDNGQICFCYKY